VPNTPQPPPNSCFRPDVLAGKVALVTGGGSGIGATIAARLAEHGARVALCGRTQGKLDEMVAALTAAGAEAFGQVADVRRPEQVEQVMQAIEARWGRLDVVVNNAAGNFLCPAVSLSPNGFGTVVDIDLKGTFNTSRAAFPLLSRAGGAVINISATLHYGATPLQAHASAAKAGVDALTRSLALEWGPAGIRVNAIAPGPIDDTEGMTRLLPTELRERAEQSVPLRRFGTKGEIADAALFLASPASAYVTGAVLVVDGGQWLAGSMALMP
jgi:peroxisomal 2,4-dienoyl-CoA reductase